MKKLGCWFKRKNIIYLSLLSLILLSFSPTSSFETDDFISFQNPELIKSIIEESEGSALLSIDSMGGISSELDDKTIAIIAAAVTIEVGIPSNLPEKSLFHRLPNQ